MIPVAYAVLCKSGEVHIDDDHSWVFLDRDQADDAVADRNPFFGVMAESQDCGPHRVVTLYRRGSQTPSGKVRR